MHQALYMGEVDAIGIGFHAEVPQEMEMDSDNCSILHLLLIYYSSYHKIQYDLDQGPMFKT